MSNEALLKEMGLRISQKRKAALLTQEQVAEKMSVSVQMISNLELGKKAIRPENLIKLCEVLKVSSDYILTGKRMTNDAENMCEKIASLSERDQRIIAQLVELCLSEED